MLGNASGAVVREGKGSIKTYDCDSRNGLTGHQGRRILSQIGRRRPPKYTEARRDDRGIVAGAGYARALGRTAPSVNYEPRVKRKQ